MVRSFGAVENKFCEAEFFLQKLHPEEIAYETASYYLSAFASSSRSITFAIQSSMSGLPNFEGWWETKQKELRNNPLAEYFLSAPQSE
jgi:hypothetical protein